MDASELEKRVSRLNAPVKARLGTLLRNGKAPNEVYGLLSEFLLVEGKQLRPALCIAACSAVGGKAGAALHAATAIEMFHNFTLIHDDIEDGSCMRRGRPCMHMKYGLPLALNAGDGLFMMVWREALNIGGARGVEAQKRLLSAFTQVLEGQAIELGWHQRREWGVGEDDYYRMVEGKTGALIAVSCEVGAFLGGADEKSCKALWRFGMGIGKGFQIIDDALNLVGDEKKYRKEIGGDIREGKRTLMTIWALASLPKGDAAELEGILQKEGKSDVDVSRAIALVRKSGAVERATKTADGIVKAAMDELSALPKNRGRGDLELIAGYIVARER